MCKTIHVAFVALIGVCARVMAAEASDPAQSVYVAMTDGTRLAADVWLPQGAAADARFPVVLEFARYWRGIAGQAPKAIITAFAARGFAYVIVDVRGTGASFGTRANEHSIAETRDFAELIRWAATQRWSTGEVLTTGSSYAGTAAELAMYNAPAALKLSIPRFSDFDLYRFLLFPGGLTNNVLLSQWIGGLRALDLGKVSATVPSWRNLEGLRARGTDVDIDGQLFALALREHAGNRYPLGELTADSRDDMEEGLDMSSAGSCLIMPYRLQRNVRLRQIPSFHVASFMDAGTAAGALARFAGSDAPMAVMIGYWSHGGGNDANPFGKESKQEKAASSYLNEYIVSYAQRMLRDETDRTGRHLVYFTAGENEWKKSATWPPAGAHMRSFYLSAGRALSTQSPVSLAGADRYTVDFEAGSGAFSRWNQFAAVRYDDRAKADARLLTYTSAPLADDLELTGHPLVELHMSSTQADGAVIAYLESVAPDGTVTMLTEGQLRLIHRRLSQDDPPYPMFGPYHSFARQDARPMTPGRIESLSFLLLPLSVRVPKTHRIRLALAGHDRDVFTRLPSDEVPEYEFLRHVGAASRLVLPVVEANVVNDK